MENITTASETDEDTVIPLLNINICHVHGQDHMQYQMINEVATFLSM